LGYVAQVVALDPASIQKVDTDELIDAYGDSVGIAPKIVRGDEQVAAMRQAEAQAEQARQQAEAMQSVSLTAKNLGGASTEEGTALGSLIEASEAGQVV
jgi:hypothetical protein